MSSSEREQTRTSIDQMARQLRRLVVPENLGDEAKSVLAVLALAALWPTKFEGGWVTVSQFGRDGRYLGERTKRESLTSAIRRGLRAIGRLADPPLVESQRTLNRDSTTQRALKEDDRRFREPIPLAIQLWVLREGGRYLVPELWREFLAAEYRPALTLQEIASGLDETVARTLLSQGQHDDAIRFAREALDRATSVRDRRPLELVLATALMRRGDDAGWSEAFARLAALAGTEAPLIDHHDRLTQARTLVAFGYARFFLELRGQEPATESHRQCARQIRSLLARALAYTSDFSPADRGQVANLEGLMLKWEAQVEASPERREELYSQAERNLRQALTLWRLAHDAYSLGAALYNLGELQFSRYRLDLGHASETEVRGALVWYEASAHYTEELGTVREWYLDHGRAAECLCLLALHLYRRGDRAEANAVLVRAEKYLNAGTKHTLTASVQGRLIERVRGLLHDTRARLSPMPE